MALLLGEDDHPLRLQDLTQPLLLELCAEALRLQEDEVPLQLGEGEVILVLGEKDKILLAVAVHGVGRLGLGVPLRRWRLATTTPPG